jgi:hypothetical protein
MLYMYNEDPVRTTTPHSRQLEGKRRAVVVCGKTAADRLEGDKADEVNDEVDDEPCGGGVVMVAVTEDQGGERG